MKKVVNTVCILTVLFFVSCSPKINYLGKSYPITSIIEVFYDAGDIKKEYEVMGIMKNDSNGFSTNGLQEILDKMILLAKEKGADAILVEGYKEQQTEEINTGDGINFGSFTNIISAKMIKYKK